MQVRLRQPEGAVLAEPVFATQDAVRYPEALRNSRRAHLDVVSVVLEDRLKIALAPRIDPAAAELLRVGYLKLP